ncbi:MAG: hypothetical protein AAB403_11735, partial [Planctomycetota bacterium]
MKTAVLEAGEVDLLRHMPVMPGFELVRREGGLVIQRDRSYHARMKEVPAAAVAKAAANGPLKSLPCDDTEIQIGDAPDALQLYMSAYLRRLFPSMDTIGIDYTIVEFDVQVDERKVAEQEALYVSMAMRAQADRLREDFRRFLITREMLAWIWDQNLLRPGTKLSPTILATLLHLVEQGQSSSDKATFLKMTQGVLGFMSEHGLLRPNTVIPMSMLPELSMAVPVWYFVPTQAGFHQSPNDLWSADDPAVTADLQFFCDAVPGSQNWSDLFLLFNRRMRDISLYNGEEIPPPLMRL